MIRKLPFSVFFIFFMGSPFNLKAYAQDQAPYPEHHQPPAAQEIKPHSSLLQKYVRSIVAGGIIGTGIGIASGLVDRTELGLIFPITWYAFRKLRQEITKSILEAMGEDRIEHYKYIVHNSAWICSWLSWLVMMQSTLHFKLVFAQRLHKKIIS